MDQNQTVDNDLQKAIDDITNTTNVDPVFSDPVAAPSSIPEGDTGALGEPVGPFAEAKVEMVTPGPEPIAPLQSMNIPELNGMEPAPAPANIPDEPAAPATEPVMQQPEVEPIPESLNVSQIKTAALRDLIPLLDKIEMPPSQKFNIYRDAFEDLKDYTVIESAYRSAREIPEEAERANALLYLVESIDKM